MYGDDNSDPIRHECKLFGGCIDGICWPFKLSHLFTLIASSSWQTSRAALGDGEWHSFRWWWELQLPELQTQNVEALGLWCTKWMQTSLMCNSTKWELYLQHQLGERSSKLPSQLHYSSQKGFHPLQGQSWNSHGVLSSMPFSIPQVGACY